MLRRSTEGYRSGSFQRALLLRINIEKQIVKTREVKNLNVFTRKNKMYVHDNFCFVTCIGSQS